MSEGSSLPAKPGIKLQPRQQPQVIAVVLQRSGGRPRALAHRAPYLHRRPSRLKLTPRSQSYGMRDPLEQREGRSTCGQGCGLEPGMGFAPPQFPPMFKNDRVSDGRVETVR